MKTCKPVIKKSIGKDSEKKTVKRGLKKTHPLNNDKYRNH